MARYERDPQIGEFLLRGWLAGQALGQRRREDDNQLAFERDREQRYVEQMEWQRRQAEAAQAQELKRQAADASIMQGLFPQQPQQQFQDPGVQGLMGGMQQSGMLPQQAPPPDLRQLLGQYGAMASPQVMQAAAETLQAKQQQQAEESARQYQAQRLVSQATDMDREISAREQAIRKAGNNPNDPLVQQANQQLQSLYRRRAGLQAGIDSLVNGVPAATLMSSYDDVYKQQGQQQTQQPTISQQIDAYKSATEAKLAPLMYEKRMLESLLQPVIGSGKDSTGLSTAAYTALYNLPNGDVIQGFELLRRLHDTEQSIQAIQQGAAQQLGGLVQGQPQQMSPQMPVQPQQPIGAPPQQQQAAPLSLPDLIAQIDAQHPDWTDEQVLLHIKQNYNVGN